MGTMTLSEMQTEVRANFAGRADLSDAAGLARITLALNRAQTILARLAAKFEELEVSEDKILTFTGVPATDRTLAFSSLANANPHKIWSVRVLDGQSTWRLVYVPNRKFDFVVPFPQADTVNKPRFYSVWQRTFEWFPVIDQAYTMRLRLSKWPLILTTAGQLSDFNEKDELLMAKATELLFRSLKMHDDADRWKSTFNDLSDEALVNDNTVPDALITPMPSLDTVPNNNWWADPFVRSAEGGY